MQKDGEAMHCPICMHTMETNGLIEADRSDSPIE